MVQRRSILSFTLALTIGGLLLKHLGIVGFDDHLSSSTRTQSPHSSNPLNQLDRSRLPSTKSSSVSDEPNSPAGFPAQSAEYSSPETAAVFHVDYLDVDNVPHAEASQSAHFRDDYSHAYVEDYTSPSENASPDFRILIAVMSPYWASARRQIVRYAYSRFPKDLPFDVVFVEGNLTAAVNEDRVRHAQRKVIEWENNTYHDIMHLDCRENLNDGKTYEFLKKVGLEFSHAYTHVMKTDDDAFVNIPGKGLCECG